MAQAKLVSKDPELVDSDPRLSFSPRTFQSYLSMLGDADMDPVFTSLARRAVRIEGKRYRIFMTSSGFQDQEDVRDVAYCLKMARKSGIETEMQRTMPLFNRSAQAGYSPFYVALLLDRMREEMALKVQNALSRFKSLQDDVLKHRLKIEESSLCLFTDETIGVQLEDRIANRFVAIRQKLSECPYEDIYQAVYDEVFTLYRVGRPDDPDIFRDTFEHVVREDVEDLAEAIGDYWQAREAADDAEYNYKEGHRQSVQTQECLESAERKVYTGGPYGGRRYINNLVVNHSLAEQFRMSVTPANEPVSYQRYKTTVASVAGHPMERKMG